MIKDRLSLYRDAGITTMLAKLDGERRLDTPVQLVDLATEVTAEVSGRSS